MSHRQRCRRQIVGANLCSGAGLYRGAAEGRLLSSRAERHESNQRGALPCLPAIRAHCRHQSLVCAPFLASTPWAERPKPARHCDGTDKSPSEHMVRIPGTSIVTPAVELAERRLTGNGDGTRRMWPIDGAQDAATFSGLPLQHRSPGREDWSFIATRGLRPTRRQRKRWPEFSVGSHRWRWLAGWRWVSRSRGSGSPLVGVWLAAGLRCGRSARRRLGRWRAAAVSSAAARWSGGRRSRPGRSSAAAPLSSADLVGGGSLRRRRRRAGLPSGCGTNRTPPQFVTAIWNSGTGQDRDCVLAAAFARSWALSSTTSA